MKRWQQAGGQLHAVDAPSQPVPGEEFRALCGASVTPGRDDFDVVGKGHPQPTCWDCEGIWRQLDGMEPLEVNAP